MNLQQKKERTIKAYQLAVATDNLLGLHSIKRTIAHQQLNLKNDFFSKYLFGRLAGNIELVARQLLLARLNSIPFNIHLLNSVAYQEPLHYSLPEEWKPILIAKGIQVNRFRTSVYFQWFIFKRLCINIWQVIKLLISVCGKKYRHRSPALKRIHFCDISNNCIAWNDTDDCYTITNWYMKWAGRVEGVKEITHNVSGSAEIRVGDVTIFPADLFSGMDQKDKIRFLFWSIGAIAVASGSFFIGRWQNPLLLHEAVMAKVIEETKAELLAKEYLFSISSFAVRPLWTYIAEAKGSVITNYSYASSFQGIKTKNGYVNQDYPFEITSWPRLLYWTDSYVSFLKTVVDQNITVIQVPPVYHSDQLFDFPEIKEKCVAVFDVSPVEEYENVIRLPEAAFRNYENGKKFLMDIYLALESKKIKILWKRKRGFSKMHSNEYMAFCDSFEKLPNVICIPPGVSAFRVVKKSNFCISMPFTSTAFIGVDGNIPSVFYDPYGTMYKDDRGAQGVELLSGIDELKGWIERNVN